MLVPADYDDAALHDPVTRRLMDRIEFLHGGPAYDEKYPDGIPTTLEIVHRTLGTVTSGLVMYPEGHARNTSGNLKSLLEAKFRRLAGQGVADVDALYKRVYGPGREISRRNCPTLRLRNPRYAVGFEWRRGRSCAD